MAEALPSKSKSPISSHEQNISILLDKLKEFGMSTDNSADTRIFKRVESKFFQHELIKKSSTYVIHISSRFASKRS